MKNLLCILLILIITGCAMTPHPRFDTQEEIDEYIKKHGLPESGDEYNRRFDNRQNLTDISWAKVGMTKSEVGRYIGYLLDRRPSSTTTDALGTTEVYTWRDGGPHYTGLTFYFQNDILIQISY